MKNLILLLPLLILPLFAEETLDSTKSILWEDGQIILDITASTDLPWNGPSSRYRIDGLISRRAPVLTVQTLSDLLIDSNYRAGEAILENSSLYGKLQAIPEIIGKTFSTASEDRRSLTVRYTIPLFPDLASIFIPPQGGDGKADPVPRDLRYQATDDFTGLIIYAAERLPLQGSNRTEWLKPALFPELYDKSLSPILKREMVKKEYLEKWGTAAYDIDSSKDYYGERVGAFPLRTMATAIFGEKGCDLILDDLTARRLLSSQHNRNLLAMGKVMIIYSSNQ